MFSINGFIHRRIIDKEANIEEVVLDVEVDNMDDILPEDTSYYVFVTLENGVPTLIEEIALGSGDPVAILSEEQKQEIRNYILKKYTSSIKMGLFCVGY